MNPTRTHSQIPKPQQWNHKSHLKSQITLSKHPKFLIPTLISTLKTPQNPSSIPILKSCSTKLLHILQKSSFSSFLHTHLNTILALIPNMMFCDEIIGIVAKIIGVLTLFSIEVNEMIANDRVILKGLVLKIVGCENWDLKMVLVNVLLDVCVTCLGRQTLLEVFGLDYVMLGFLQIKKSIASAASIIIMEKDVDLCLGAELTQDELPLLLITALVTLTNACSTEQLKTIPRKLIETLCPHLNEIWSIVHKQLLASKVTNHSKDKCCRLTNITAYNLAESIFRLSMHYPSTLMCEIPSDVILSHLFGTEELSFKDFMSEHWESSLFLMNSGHPAHDIFSPFTHSLTSEETMPGFLASLLQGMVSCPPVALDEINGLNFLNDIRDTLGCPLIYQQDIRVVKTNTHSKMENHYFQESLSKISRPFSFDDILKCEVAYKEGYTIAIRGMEYRLKSIAHISQLVANVFGQPSVGANLYITPPESQGLACHCDDHCVFVCQLRGSKEWNVFPQSVVKLPRLYEQLEVPKAFLRDSTKILLREGDVLYIPRGFAHEACTVSGISESFSAHLTLAIEVQSPFEWEGFVHVALYEWSHRKQTDNFASDNNRILHSIYVNILHVAIRLISHNEPLFRKACLVAATSLPQETKVWLDENQRDIFNQLINKVHELANFKDSIKFLEFDLKRNEDSFHWLRWLEHFNEEDVLDRNSVDFDLGEIGKIISSIDEEKAKVEAGFGCVKSKFCDEIVFDDARERFQNLCDTYKESRAQYMNGMLSLH